MFMPLCQCEPRFPEDMKSLHFLARFCARQITLRVRAEHVPANLGRSFSTFRYVLSRSAPRRQYQAKGIILKAAVNGALGTAAFVKLSEKDNGGTEHTAEGRMLKASTQELEKTVDEDKTGISRWAEEVIIFLDLYIWEPLCTGFRFFQLVVIFVPVILSVPAIWFGSRQPDQNNEKSGTLWWYNFLVWGMETAGPAFIKVRAISPILYPLRSLTSLVIQLGQWAASRTDIFPIEMCNVMSKLHSNAPAHSLHATKRIVQAAFDGRPFSDIFEEFQEQPLGVGAIAQVYKAKLKPDLAVPGDIDVLDAPANIRANVRRNVNTVLKSSPHRVPSTYVAIKVLHPGVERTHSTDTYHRVVVATRRSYAVWGDDEATVDLRIEAANLAKFRKNFKDRSTAWFPFPYLEFTTREVLIEEFAQGIPLADFLENGGGAFQRDIAHEGLDAFLRMLLIDNFVHADLHPGNIMKPHFKLKSNEQVNPEEQPDVTEEVLSRLRPYRKKNDKAAWEAELSKIDAEGFRPQLIFIDTGLVTELNNTNRRNFLDLFRAVAEFDGYKAGHLMCERCRQPEAVIDKEIFALKMQHPRLISQEPDLGSWQRQDRRYLTTSPRHGPWTPCQTRRRLCQRRHHGWSVGDYPMAIIWAGLEARRFMQASIEDVRRLLLLPIARYANTTFLRWNDASNMIYCRQMCNIMYITR
ncbi:hypothetical protein RRF57_011117 [Xylaria bambusicola]|uniref:ABC1 atypical kinase-like domain-containing protein n=1 Tax=Xylaria bambusicola TaxID=326684 RepID=A0AAN7Z3C5_9PEZI